MSKVKPPKNSERERERERKREVKNNLLIALGIVFITFVFYQPALFNGLTNWDDNNYLNDNELIQKLNWENIKAIFSKKVMGNYHPLTVLSYAIEYHFVQLKPFLYHFDNIILHLINTFLVFRLSWKLFANRTICITSTLLFALHPMHVESVAWVSERKDVMYTCFYLIAWIYYLKFKETSAAIQKYLWATYVFFLLSLLSKGQAVTFPVVLVLTDYLQDKKLHFKTILSKLPFFLIALVFGIIALIVQNKAGAIHDLEKYNFAERLLLGCYALLCYIVKFVFPINLSAFYPYPSKEDGIFPFLVYLGPLILAMGTFFVYKKFRFNKEVLFGLGIFLVNIILLLQVLPIGDALYADRYTYVSYLGCSFITGYALKELFQSNLASKYYFITAIIVGMVVFAVSTRIRIPVWQNSITLFTDVIEKYPKVQVAYNNRGNEYHNNGRPDLAMIDYEAALKLNPKFEKVYFNRGNIYNQRKEYETAIKDYNLAIKYLPTWSSVYVNRGFALNAIGKYKEALADYNKVIELDPSFIEIYFNRGITNSHLGNYEQAIKDFNKALEKDPNWEGVLYNRANTYQKIGKYDLSTLDLNKVIELNPNSPFCYGDRGINEYKQGRYQEAVDDLTVLINQNVKEGKYFYYRSQAHKALGRLDLANEDEMKAKEFGFLGEGQ